jgi:hypothetical protein
VWVYGLDSICSGQSPVAGCCEHRNEPLFTMGGREFIHQLSDY